MEPGTSSNEITGFNKSFRFNYLPMTKDMKNEYIIKADK